MTITDQDHHQILQDVARHAMIERGLEPDLPSAALRQASAMTGPAGAAVGVRDLRHLPWASIDNDDSLDLDQLTVAQSTGGVVRVMVAIADVAGLVDDGSPIDRHARANTTTVYTAGGIFPMLPLRLSNDLTSLNPAQDRRAVVVAYDVAQDGAVAEGEVFAALVRNKAKLAYGAVGAWLEGRGPVPPAVAAAEGVADQIKMQDGVARALRKKRHEMGALRLETLEPRAHLQDGMVRDLVVEPKNRAHDLIEDIMVAANTVTTRFLTTRGFATFRRVVRVPERWDRIRAVAAELGDALPAIPDSQALNEFLRRRRRADPLRFPDLSLTVVKLIGSGEYVVHQPHDAAIGHFGLAVRDYTHSTAPNRRYPDVITQRQIHCALEGRPSPYSNSTLRRLAHHCTDQEDVVKKVERQVLKSAAALLLEPRIGTTFDGLVTGASAKGTWVRLLRPSVEGKLLEGEGNLDVGDQVTVRLVSVDVERGFIDLAAVGATLARR